MTTTREKELTKATAWFGGLAAVASVAAVFAIGALFEERHRNKK